jgi:hypothetical protein
MSSEWAARMAHDRGARGQELDYSYSITIQFGDKGIPVRLTKLRDPPAVDAGLAQAVAS